MQTNNWYQTYVAVLFLHEFEEGGHVRTAEMIDSLQAGEHASTVQALKMVFTNVLKKAKIKMNKLTSLVIKHRGLPSLNTTSIFVDLKVSYLFFYLRILLTV